MQPASLTSLLPAECMIDDVLDFIGMNTTITTAVILAAGNQATRS